MTVLRNLLMGMFAVMAIYTGVVILREGVGLFPVFFGDLVSLTWRGQFNLDFACYLVLGGLWVAWRSGFSGRGVIWGLLVSVLGMTLLAPLMLVMSAQAGGDPRRLLLGVHAGERP